MSNPYRGEMKSTGAAKGRAMGITNEFLPERASRISGKPNQGSAPTPPGTDQPQFREDQQAPDYNNNASGWVRGAGENAESKPGFDRSKAGR